MIEQFKKVTGSELLQKSPRATHTQHPGSAPLQKEGPLCAHEVRLIDPRTAHLSQQRQGVLVDEKILLMCFLPNKPRDLLYKDKGAPDKTIDQWEIKRARKKVIFHSEVFKGQSK